MRIWFLLFGFLLNSCNGLMNLVKNGSVSTTSRSHSGIFLNIDKSSYSCAVNIKNSSGLTVAEKDIQDMKNNICMGYAGTNIFPDIIYNVHIKYFGRLENSTVSNINKYWNYNDTILKDQWIEGHRANSFVVSDGNILYGSESQQGNSPRGTGSSSDKSGLLDSLGSAAFGGIIGSWLFSGAPSAVATGAVLFGMAAMAFRDITSDIYYMSIIDVSVLSKSLDNIGTSSSNSEINNLYLAKDVNYKEQKNRISVLVYAANLGEKRAMRNIVRVINNNLNK